VKINVNGKDVEATAVSFVSAGEPFIEYHLEDGNVARVKFVMTRIFATGERNAQTNEPIYSFQFQAVAVIEEQQAKPTVN
jgi:hypothetical protein